MFGKFFQQLHEALLSSSIVIPVSQPPEGTARNPPLGQYPPLVRWLPFGHHMAAASKGCPMEAPTPLRDLHWTPLEGPVVTKGA